jgi:glycosyltransferase involved in cell wall biosynthesis
MSNGVDVDRFDRAKVDATATGALPDGLQRLAAERDAIVVGYVGRLARDKGIEVLWRAWARIREEYAGAHLLLVGPWEREAPVSDACRHALESDDRVHLTGDVPDVVPYYRLMSMFVLPSFREGFPNAPMEAAAMGLPVIATRVVGSVDAVEDGVTGLLVPPRDADALAAAMRTYLDAPDLRRRHGDAGATRVRTDFRQEVIWDALLQEYRRLLCHGGVGFPETAPQLGAASLRGAFVHEERTQ